MNLPIKSLSMPALALVVACSNEPNWHVERDAVKSDSHPYAGFWKGEDCDDDFGWAIGPAGDNTYYVSFCGPGGCFEKGTYRPNTPIVGDPNYKVIDENTLQFKSRDGWSTHTRCSGRT